MMSGYWGRLGASIFPSVQYVTLNVLPEYRVGWL